MDRKRFLNIVGCTLAVAAIPGAFAKEPGSRKDIILCFDGGSDDFTLMSKSLELSREVFSLIGEQPHFTYFLNSCFYFPRLKGKSNIGWGGSLKDIETRIKITQKAIDLGHEIGNHTVRHLHGGGWDYQQWYDELAEFDEHIAGLFVDTDGHPYKPLGFRAPYLEWNDNMYRALSDLGYTYDISTVGEQVKKRHGIICIGTPTWTRDNGRYVLGIDFNWMENSVTANELALILSRECTNRNPLIISLHIAGYHLSNEKVSYYNIVRDFMFEGARMRNFKFISLLDYFNALQDVQENGAGI